MDEFMTIFLGYVVVFFLSLIVTNMLTKGLFFKILTVKMSKGKKVLLEILSVDESYFITGSLSAGDVIYSDREVKMNKSDPKRLTNLSKNCFFRRHGVKSLTVDESTNEVLKPDLTNVQGFDAIRTENLIVRALQSNSKGLENKMIAILVIILIIIFFVAVGILFKVNTLDKAIHAMQTVAPVI